MKKTETFVRLWPPLPEQNLGYSAGGEIPIVILSVTLLLIIRSMIYLHAVFTWNPESTTAPYQHFYTAVILHSSLWMSSLARPTKSRRRLQQTYRTLLSRIQIFIRLKWVTLPCKVDGVNYWGWFWHMLQQIRSFTSVLSPCLSARRKNSSTLISFSTMHMYIMSIETPVFRWERRKSVYTLFNLCSYSDILSVTEAAVDARPPNLDDRFSFTW